MVVASRRRTGLGGTVQLQGFPAKEYAAEKRCPALAYLCVVRGGARQHNGFQSDIIG
jgi:hypothetical protein